MSKGAFRGFFLFCFGVALICFSLGAWQLQRHFWKAELLEQANEQALASAIDFPADVDSLSQFTRLQVSGTFLSDKDILIRGFAVNGVSGSRIYSPFELTDGRILIVQRGWVARNQEQAAGVQNLTKQDIEVIWRPVRARTSDRSLFSLVNVPESNLWTYIDPLALEKHWGLTGVIDQGYGELRAPAQAAESALIEEFSSDLFNRHLEYVATWWSLGIGILGIFGLIWWDQRRRRG